MLSIAERLNALGAMTACGLAPSLTREYAIEQLTACCDAVEKSGVDQGRFQNCDHVQKKLVNNPAFAERLKGLLRRGLSGQDIDGWLELEEETGCRIEDYSDEEVSMAMNLGLHSIRLAQIFAMLFMRKYTDDVTREAIIGNLRCFRRRFEQETMPDEKEQALFTHAFLSRYLSSVDTAVVFPQLAESAPLIALMDFLHEKHVDITFDGHAMGKLYGMTDEVAGKLRQLFEVLGNDACRIGEFLRIWLENDASEGDIDIFTARARRMTVEEQEAAMESRLAYLHALYSGSIGKIQFDKLRIEAFDMMAYAITHRQNAFLRMVEANFDVFQRVQGTSMLFDRDFYTRVQLNAVTAKNLCECVSGYTISRRGSHLDQLKRRVYTFDEMKTLCDAPVQYIRLYNALEIPRTDDRLLVLRQLLKRDLLDKDVSEGQICELARHLSGKPFVAWREQLSKGIRGMTPRLCVRLLCRYDAVSRFLPGLSNAAEASFLLRHAGVLEGYETWAQVRSDIERIDTDWVELRKQLKLDDAFVRDHEEAILDFLYQDGASIALAYQSGLDNPEGFYRILRALLMGRYGELKYHSDDLQREIGFTVSDQQKNRWMENSALEQGSIVAEERDDFFSTIQIGVIPQRTCLNYRDGAYRECLLACFDSNKKILYATVNGKPTARAMLRLTKGREKSDRGAKQPSLEFADLTEPEGNGQAHPTPHGDAEELVVFLERAYISGVDPTTTDEIRCMFIALARNKAEELGARIVLASDYRANAAQMQFVAMNYHLYISKTKAGIQYLDSLGGSCGVSNEGSYKQNLFMLLPEG